MNSELIIYAISDMHGELPDPDTIPECDVFIIAGDSCPWQDYHDVITQSVWLNNVFKPWINEGVNASKIILIGGNHDFVMQDRDFKDWAVRNLWCDYLEDKRIDYKGVTFYGTPWVPRLKNWAFYGTEDKLTNTFALIPDDTDVLISHGPPLGVNDAIAKSIFGEHAGSEELALQFQSRERNGYAIPVNIHGHIHEGYGFTEKWGTKFYNVSAKNRDYESVNELVKIEL